ncbi:MAG: RNA degradosome polyphosphate kinase [Saccharofermentanales bacterium]|jgi:polyphosphate kinase
MQYISAPLYASDKSGKGSGKKRNERQGKKGDEIREQIPVPDLFINRELSWLDFNDRVLDESRLRENPLLERVKFLAISCSNLDEFFMVRVASLKDMAHAGYTALDPAGLSVEEQLTAIAKKTHKMVRKQYSTYSRILFGELKEAGIYIRPVSEINSAGLKYLDNYFKQFIHPILTPLAVDVSRPFPLISNRSLNIICKLRPPEQPENEEPSIAVVQVPAGVSRLVSIPGSGDGQSEFVLLEEVVKRNLGELFRGAAILSAGCFRIMRNADLDIDTEEAADLLNEIEKQVRKRQWGEVIRLEAESNLPEDLLSQLCSVLQLQSEDIYEINGPLDLTFLFKIAALEGYPNLCFEPFTAPVDPDLMSDPFGTIRDGDRLLHHPYQSFEPITELLRRAATDPQVLAIKQTLYRVSGDSPIIHSLTQAAENGKQVMVLVELQARFDEANNINWARRLEQAGCHVIYGLVGLKVHSKITLIVREEETGIRRYMHLGTGNYNDQTAKIYSDIGLLTCSESIAADATEFFNMISGYSAPLSWRRLTVAPFWLRREFERLIEQETAHATAGRPARIVIKINSLVDPEMISHLYRASRAGVEVDLIVRGICCLRAGVPGLSENITVRSIVGRFLEHARIYLFHNDGQNDLFLSSADLMPRNLDRRIELLFPIEDKTAFDTLMELLELQLSDTERSRIMDPEGVYHPVDRRGKTVIDCQQALIEQARLQNKQLQAASAEIRFQPVFGDDPSLPVSPFVTDDSLDNDT